jgi:hypothetical protein
MGNYNFNKDTGSGTFKNLESSSIKQNLESSSLKQNGIQQEQRSEIPYIQVLENDLSENNVINKSNANTSYVYAYDTNNLNISGLLGVPGEFFINNALI